MKKYRVYRSLRVKSIEDIDMDNLGIAWAQDENAADGFSYQFGENYIIVSAIVSEYQIDFDQTCAQWDSKEHGNEGEVVLKELEDIEVEYQGYQYHGNTGVEVNNETRPEPIKCNPNKITQYLETV